MRANIVGMDMKNLAVAAAAFVLLLGCVPKAPPGTVGLPSDKIVGGAGSELNSSAPTASAPSPTATGGAAASGSPTPSASASSSPSTSPSPTAAATATQTATTAAPTTAASTAAPTQQATPPPSPSPSPSPTPTPSPTPSPSPTLGNAPPAPPPGASIGVYGKVTDTASGAPVPGICVTLGIPGALCWAITDSSGNYAIDGSGTVQPGSTWQLYFFTCRPGVVSLDKRSCTNPTAGYASQASDSFALSGVARKDWAIHK